MMDIKGSLDAFIHGQLDFNGLLEIVGRVAVEDRVQIPELIDSDFKPGKVFLSAEKDRIIPCESCLAPQGHFLRGAVNRFPTR